jgi:probable selenate reductase FAD-binding subunit
MQIKEYIKPASVEEALALIRRKNPPTVVLSGGTWLNGQTSHDNVIAVDISELGLGRIVRLENPPILSLGATVTLQSLAETAVDLKGFEILGSTAHAMAALNIRNRATIGGVIVTADTASPLVTALLAYDAELVVQAEEERNISLSGFLAYRERILAEGMLITSIRLPVPSAETHAAYERIARTPSDYPIVCAVTKCAVKDGIAGNMRIAIGGVASVPIRLNAMEFALEKKSIHEWLDSALDVEIGNLTPDSNWLGSAEYRREMARVLVRRTVMKAAGISVEA